MPKALAVDLPYPSTENLTKDAASARIISPAYADRTSEMTAILQYVFQSVIFSGLGMQENAQTLQAIAIAEMHHLDLLGEMLLGLGTTPVFSAQPPYPFRFYSAANVSYATSPQRMLMDDIRGEKQAIRDYESMVRRLDNEQVAAVISRIILDEELHLEKLTKMLEELS